MWLLGSVVSLPPLIVIYSEFLNRRDSRHEILASRKRARQSNADSPTRAILYTYAAPVCGARGDRVYQTRPSPRALLAPEPISRHNRAHDLSKHIPITQNVLQSAPCCLALAAKYARHGPFAFTVDIVAAPHAGRPLRSLWRNGLSSRLRRLRSFARKLQMPSYSLFSSRRQWRVRQRRQFRRRRSARICTAIPGLCLRAGPALPEALLE